jgi:Right handed beta helix region
MLRSSSALIIAAVALLGVCGSPAHAQSTRTWVSGVGDDANPCSRTMACKTYAGAISKTAAGGEISTLDPGGFGSFTITKSISVAAAGVEGGILVAGGTGIIINAGATDVVHLDGLFFEGTGNGLSGIRILAAGAVHIRNCAIRGFQGAPGLGIEIAATATTQVFISNCAITKNSGGVLVKPNGGAAQVFLDRVQVAGNTGSGIRAEGASAVVRLNNSVVFGNGMGLDPASGGAILSFGTNAIAGNATDGSPTGSLPLK